MFDKNARHAIARVVLHQAGILVLMLSAAACDSASSIAPDAVQAAFESRSVSTCPDPMTGEGRAMLIVQLFAADGTTVTEGDVVFTADRGELASVSDPTRVARPGPLAEPVDRLGQARVVLRASRIPGDPAVEVSAVLPSGEELTRQVVVSPAPQLVLIASPSVVSAGAPVAVQLALSSACNVVRLRVTLEFDPDVLEFVEALPGDRLERRGVGLATVPTVLDAAETTPGRISVDYRQTGTDLVGSSVSGTYLTLQFVAREPGPAGLRVPSYSVSPATGPEYRVQPVTPPVLTVAAPPA